jgi:mannose-6-phosphate isomerase-like protein (cupin superfamily)
MIEKINLAEKFGAIDRHWSPRIAGELNGQHVRLATLQGAFVWHAHEHEDELFLVVKGRLRLELRDGFVELGEGEMAIVPRGVEHRPVAENVCWVLLFEPASTVNTGATGGERTVTDLERV